MRASRGGLGDATQGAGTTILPQISHTSKFGFIYDWSTRSMKRALATYCCCENASKIVSAPCDAAF